MKKLFLTALLVPVMALAQTYPSPTFSSMTLQNPLTAANGGTGATASTGTGSVALSASPTFTGVPVAPTAAQGTNTTQLATVAYTNAALNSGLWPGSFTSLSAAGTVSGAGFTSLLSPYALLTSPALTGVPTAPNASAGTNTTQIATTAFVEGTLQSPQTGIGSGTPNSGAFTSLSASGAVSGAGFTSLLSPYAPLASPALSGTPTAPNAAAGTSTTQLATTAFVQGTVAQITVPSNAVLLTYSTALMTRVWRLGFTSPGDVPPILYTAFGAACPLNSGAGDNGSQVPSSNGQCWMANFPANGVDVGQYGAKGDGTTDDYGAITNALAGSPAAVFLAPKAYRVSGGIIIPPFKALKGESFGAYVSGAISNSFPMIIGDLAVPTIVTVTGGSAGEGVALQNVMVNRAAGAVPAGSISVAVTNSNANLTVQDVTAMRSSIGFSIGAGTTTSLGIHCLRCYTRQITNYHVQISNAVETTFTEGRFGANGGADVAATGYINILGGTVDTVRFQTSQFNQSGATVFYLVDFTGASDANGIVSFDNCHAEQWTAALVHADPTSSLIRSLRFVGNTLDGPSSAIFYSGSAGVLAELMLTGNRMDGGYSMTLNQQTSSVVTGNNIVGAVLVNQGTQVISGNFFQSTVTLQGSTTRTVFVGNGVAGTLSNTMTGNAIVASNG